MSDSTTRLVLDLGALESLVSELRSTHDSLASLANTADAVAGEVGHAGLAAHVHDFASSWERHRTHIVANVQALCDEFTSIVTGVEQADSDLASALTTPSTS